jgi:hypothetical protein
LSSPEKRAYHPDFVSAQPSEANSYMPHYTEADSLHHEEKRHTARLEISTDTNGYHNINGGLSSTKFGAGFTRKQEKDVQNPAADQVNEYYRLASTRKQMANDQRKHFIDQTLNRNGYNPVTGKKLEHIEAPLVRHEGKRLIIPQVSHEVAANSRIFLRESEARFFMPHATGPKHEYRQDVTTKGGITKPCHSALLQPGKSDFPSFGIEDNFSKSQYPGSQPQDPNYKRLDLPEMREAGKYTPRKQPGNPSGNPELVMNWGSGMDISNKALRGKI